MRVLILLRGAPGCGKTTWIESNGLKPYSLSADDLRVMCQSPILGVDGSYGISQSNDGIVWKTLFQLLEARMQRGELTVIDATNSKTAEMNRYKALASEYRFRIILVDMTTVPIEVCKKQNSMRPEFKQVPEDIIDMMYARFATQTVPPGIKVIAPDQIESIWYKPIDLSHYKKIHHIGDIHGCYTALNNYLKGEIHADEFYIFTGDYIDRGLENAEVVKFLYSIFELPNILLLEGNHERWLHCYGKGIESRSQEFECHTKQELISAGITEKDARILYRKFAQCAYYKFNNQIVLVTHGGLSMIPNNLSLVATEEMIKGTGQYDDYEAVAHTFDEKMADGVYQIFGHRNTKSLPVKLSKRCFDLENSVEFGGALRIVTLDSNGFSTIEIPNPVFRELNIKTKNDIAPIDIESLVASMRSNKYIAEKKFGHISSFNFTPKAFYDKAWDDQTTKARGLFIDTENWQVVARAYEKFFNINERTETKFSVLRNVLEFPVTAYVKENGFLGLVSYDRKTDDLFIASKSTPEGPYASYLKEIFFSQVNDIDAVKRYLKSNNVTLVFECIDPENDPHIIKYPKKKVVLLDIVENNIHFKKRPYFDVAYVADMLHIECKHLAVVLPDWQSFCDWYYKVMENDYQYNGNHIEGFVVEDADGFMIKVKLHYYHMWKHLRGVVDSVNQTGYYKRTSSLVSKEENLFYGWYKTIGKDLPGEKDIITLRDAFYNSFTL